MRHIEKKASYWLVDGRYSIYFDGVVYDNQAARDIPYYIYNLRDELIKKGGQ